MAKTDRQQKADGGEGGPALQGEFRTGPVAGTAVVKGVTFSRKPLQYAEIDGMAIFEGDIVLGTIDEVRTAAAADAGEIQLAVGISAGVGQQFRWPNATIPFEIDPGLPNPQRVTDAIAHWQANTRISFVQRTAANAAQFPDFVQFVNGNQCSSSVGRRGGLQTITLGPNCGTGNAIHEIGHTVGLWHEQSREDRDAFVRIEWANIDPAMQHNFDQHIADGDDLGAYDYGSIMHYPPTAFSINGQPTIVALQPIPPGVVMGQRNGLSAGDIAGVHMMYPLATFKEVPKDPILDGTIKEAQKDPPFDQTIKEVQKDPIVDGTIKEAQKDPALEPTLKEVQKDPVVDGTIKEAVRDPLGGGGTLVEAIGGIQPRMGFGNQFAGGAIPFVMAGASQFAGRAADPTAELAAQVQMLGEALAAIHLQLEQLTAVYLATVQSLSGQYGGSGR